MIIIFNAQGKKLKSIPSDDEFFNYITAEELLEEHPEFDKTNTKWSFIVFPPQKVSELYFQIKREFLTSPIKEAFRHELGLLEICKGDYENPLWVAITPDLNAGKLKKEWYLEFCRAHGYVMKRNED